MSELPEPWAVELSPDVQPRVDTEALKRILLEQRFAPSARALLEQDEGAVAAVVMCTVYYNDEGYSYQASLLPTASLPEALGDQSLSAHLRACIRGDDDVDDDWHEALDAHEITLPNCLVELFIGEHSPGWHAVAVISRGAHPRQLIIQRLPLDDTGYW